MPTVQPTTAKYNAILTAAGLPTTFLGLPEWFTDTKKKALAAEVLGKQTDVLAKAGIDINLVFPQLAADKASAEYTKTHPGYILIDGTPHKLTTMELAFTAPSTSIEPFAGKPVRTGERRGPEGNLLLGNDIISVGQSLISNNWAYHLKFTMYGLGITKYEATTGNEVSRKMLWGDFTVAPPRRASTLKMQLDGNLVLYDVTGNVPLWAAGSMGWSGLNTLFDDNGVIHIRKDSDDIWNSDRGLLVHRHTIGFFLENAASCAGRAVGTVSGGIGSAFTAVGDLASNIPIIGPAFQGVLSIVAGPFNLAESIANGEPIDEAVLGTLKNAVASVREIAPLALTIVSLVPGLGTGISAVMAGALALAAGQSIDEALVSAVRSSIPGGPLAQAAFSITVAAVSGKNILEAGVAEVTRQLDLPPQAVDAFHVLSVAVQGGRIDTALLEAAKHNLPDGPLKVAFNIGASVAQGKKLQDVAAEAIVANAPTVLGKLTDVGKIEIASNPVYQAASDVAKKVNTAVNTDSAFALGIGIMQHSGVSPVNLDTIRNQLSSTQQVAFDLAVSTKIGYVTAPKVSTAVPPMEAAAHMATIGMQGAEPQVKANMMTAIVAIPQARAAATSTIVAIANQRAAARTWWQAILHYFGLWS